MDAKLAALMKELGVEIGPMIEAAVKDAVTAASPVAGAFAAPIIDGIDALIMAHLGAAAPANAVAAPSDAASQIAQLQQHVAALTVATVGGASHMVAAKAAMATAVPVAVGDVA